MNGIKVGMVVKSFKGHDKNRFYIVVKINENFVYICDGKVRKLEKPKKKNIKHIAPTNRVFENTFVDTDKKIRKVLWDYNYGKDFIIE